MIPDVQRAVMHSELSLPEHGQQPGRAARVSCSRRWEGRDQGASVTRKTRVKASGAKVAEEVIGSAQVEQLGKHGGPAEG